MAKKTDPQTDAENQAIDSPAQDTPQTSHLSPVDLMHRIYAHKPIVAALNPDPKNPPPTAKQAAAYLAENGALLDVLQSDFELYLDLMGKSAPKDPHVAPAKARLRAIKDLRQLAAQA